MVLIVEDKATLVPHSESKLDMDVAQDDPNENNGTEDKEDNESEEDEEDIVCSNGDVEHCLIRQRDKRSNIVVDATNYISRRWRKNPLPAHLRDKRHRKDLDKLRLFLSKVKDLKKELEIDAPSQNAPQNKNALYEDLLGVKAPVIVAIKNPKKCPNKCHHRFKGAAEKVDDALYEGNKRASKDKNIDAEEEEVNESKGDEKDSES
ncbi:hypothetical protein Tco_1319476 [Tanacetum coccineum]